MRQESAPIEYPHADQIMATVWALTIVLALTLLAWQMIAYGIPTCQNPMDGTAIVIMLCVGFPGGVIAGYLLGEVAYEEPPIKIPRMRR